MILNKDNLGLGKPDCVFNYERGFLRLNYDRNERVVFITPCCNAIPIKYIEPIAFNSDYFIDNIKGCLTKYKRANLSNLSDYYYGSCLKYNRLDSCKTDSCKTDLCKNYDFNKSITIIENSIQRSCNLNCIMCNSGLKFDQYELNLSKKVYNYISKLKLDTILTTTAGEPFIDKNTIMNLVKNSNSKVVYITTNGSLLNIHDIMELSKYSDKVKITVSFDSINKDTYNKIRVNSDYYRVLNNILLLRDNNILDHVNYVLQKENMIEFKECAQFFESLNLKVDYLIDYNCLDNKECIKVLTCLRNSDSYIYKYKDFKQLNNFRSS